VFTEFAQVSVSEYLLGTRVMVIYSWLLPSIFAGGER